MNYCQTIGYDAIGTGWPWTIAQLTKMSTKGKPEKYPLVSEFGRVILRIVLDASKPLSVPELYARVPAEHRSTAAYGRMVLLLKRLSDAKRVQRSGSTGNYRYWRRGK